ncbi:hypothetical protein BKA67DRAFT_686034 [Truncatella angustata]|uniref:Uncharacterized protein n=1 Tax=Truncatella angustata TaxID=152316 RepID=A0A9P9A3Q9_9PEZI|nr:uncharacterized protein BKA67DRAFT_686034 [Truncatella angustata]KAH6659510.1 hypothetical protein BKA67DRAFT_686034 [Truncatella angustata]
MGEDDELENVPLVGTDHAQTSARHQKSWRRYLSPLYWLVALETLNVLLFVGVPSILARARQPSAYTPDEYFALSDFNRTWLFEHDDSQESWDDFYLENGIISISTEWADHHGFSPSSLTPDVPGEMSYQVGVFHSLHCLSMLRKGVLNGKISPSPHIMHCLLHLRYNLMCNADLTLGDTEDYEHYTIHQPHKCRDFNAIRRWADTFRWKGFMDWTLANLYPNDTVESLREKDKLGRLPVKEDLP